MSLSKIYQHSDSFVAKQILPSQGSSSEGIILAGDIGTNASEIICC